MAFEKISLSDLTKLENGKTIDMGAMTDIPDPTYGLVKEEVEEFLEKSHGSEKTVRPATFLNVPSTALKESIEILLKGRNIHEERAKKRIQFEFDRKMQRINKIKSRVYRRMRRKEQLRKEQQLENDSETASEDSSAVSDEESVPPAPVVEFQENSASEEGQEDDDNEQRKLVREAFGEDDCLDNREEFLEEKAAVVAADAPQIVETCLPGLDEWAGEGIEFKKTSRNTFIEKKDGIKPFTRRDFAHSHIIENENLSEVDRYWADAQYGLSKSEYKNKLLTVISPETNSLRVFKRFIKTTTKEEEALGKVIKPNEFDPGY